MRHNLHISYYLLTAAGVVAVGAVLIWPRALTSQAQSGGRGAIQTPTGGPGPGAAPGATDPANATADLSPKPPVLPLPATEQANRFWLPAGYRLEPVLSDPIIEDPAQVTFDGNGRMFVVELRGYSQTPEGIDVIPPIGRISLHEDGDNDGVFERHSVFVDKLVFPRFVTPFGANAVLTMETNADDVWKYTDTNADGVADKKELFATNFGRAGNMESQQASLFWAMDNWLYSTVNAFRLRWTPSGIVKEPTGPKSSQWGVTQDNDGKVWFQGGASGLPGYFQFPMHYGNFAPPDQFEPDLNIVWGAPILIGDIQAGLPGTRMPDGSLIYATAAAGNEIYRGDRLPKDLDWRLSPRRSRRSHRPPAEAGQDRGSHAASECLPALRVHSLARSAVPSRRHRDRSGRHDLHRGHVPRHDRGRGVGEAGHVSARKDQAVPVGQGDGAWPHLAVDVRRDRARSDDAADAERNAHAAGRAPVASERLVARHGAAIARAESRTSQSCLRFRRWCGRRRTRSRGSTPCGHSRDWARSAQRSRARLLRDPDPRMRIQALRASETLYKAGDKSFDNDYRALAKDKDVDVVIQAMLTMNVLKVAETPTAVKEVIGRQQGARGVQFVADRILNSPASRRTRRRSWRSAADSRAAEQPRAGRRYLCRAVLLVSRRRRARHADARRCRWFHAGAVARRVGTRQRPSRLRDQGRPARTFRPGGRQGCIRR